MAQITVTYVILDSEGNVIKENGVAVSEVKNAGEYTMEMRLECADESVLKNYTLSDTTDNDTVQAFKINRRKLIVTVDDSEVEYGSDAPTYTAAFGVPGTGETAGQIFFGIVAGEDLSKITDVKEITTDAGVRYTGPWLTCIYVKGSVPYDEAGNPIPYPINVDVPMLKALLPNYDMEITAGTLTVKAADGSVIWYGDRTVGHPNFEYDGYEHKPKAYLVGSTDPLPVIYVDEDGNELKDFAAIEAGYYYAKAIAQNGVVIKENETIQYQIKPREIIVDIAKYEITYGARELHTLDGSDILTSDEIKLLWSYSNKQPVGDDDLGIYFTWNVASSIQNNYLIVGTYYIEGHVGGDADVIKNYNVIFQGLEHEDEDETTIMYGLYEVIPADILDSSKRGTEWYYEEAVIEKYEQYFIRIEDPAVDEDGNPTGGYKYITFAGDQTAEVEFMYSDPYLVGRDEIPEPEDDKNYTHTEFENTGINSKGVWFINYRITIANHNVYYGQWRVMIKNADEYIIVHFIKAYELEYGDEVPENLTEILVDGGYIELSGAILKEELRGDVSVEDYFKKVARAYVPIGYNKYVTNRTKVGDYTINFELTFTADEITDDYSYEDLQTIDVIYRRNNEEEDSNIDKYIIKPRLLTVFWGETQFTYDKNAHIPMPVVSNWVSSENTLVLEGLSNGKIYEVTDAGVTVTISVVTEGNFISSGGHKVTLSVDDPNYRIAAANAVQVISIKGAFPWWLIYALAGLALLFILTVIILILVLRRRRAGISDMEGFYDNFWDEDDAGFNDPYIGNDIDGFDYDDMWNNYQ